MPSPLPWSTTFVSPVTSATPTAPAGLGHRGHDALEVAHREALLEEVAGAQEEGLRPAHGEVVDRAVDGQRADVAAGEEGRLHHEGVGGEGQPLAPDGDDGAVAERLEVRVAEGGREERLDEARGLPAPAAVGELHDVPVVEGRRAAEHLVDGAGHGATRPPPLAAAVVEVGGAGALGRDHGRPERVLRRAARAELGAVGGAQPALQHEAGPAFLRLLRPRGAPTSKTRSASNAA